jgi:hypothetical protein
LEGVVAPHPKPPERAPGYKVLVFELPRASGAASAATIASNSLQSKASSPSGTSNVGPVPNNVKVEQA